MRIYCSIAVLCILLVFSTLSGFCQYISHGPVVGGVTDSTARMYVRTHSVDSFLLQLSVDGSFTNPRMIPGETQPNLDNSLIIDLDSLAPITTYYYRLSFSNQIDSRQGSFSTFPSEGYPSNFTFVTGSCQETANMKVYDAMPLHNPDFMIHTGDFTYPSYQIGSSYPGNWSTIEESWRKRYNEVKMREMLLDVPLAYMPDDDDSYGSTFTTDVSPKYYFDSLLGYPVNYFEFDPIFPNERVNCLRGYNKFFPGYEVVDSTKAYYHSFIYGNSEFFMLDTRSLADPLSDAFFQDSITKIWSFNPGPDHSLIGQDQMNWLLNGLATSTADWKFIVSGLPFNPSLKRLIDVGLMVQGLELTIGGQTGTGFRVAVSFSGYWAGFPNDIDQVLGLIDSLNIQGVSVISGDTHHNVMDDGTNSVFPEMNASGLSVTTTELAYQMAQYAPLLGQPPVKDSLWNAGGNGLGNTNFGNAFGRVEVFGSDSVQFCIIDEDNLPLSCFTYLSDGSVRNPLVSVEPVSQFTSSAIIEKVIPNPSRGEFTVVLNGDHEKHKDLQIIVTNSSGMPVKFYSEPPRGNRKVKVTIPSVSPNGTYFVHVISGNHFDSQSVVVAK